MASTYTTNLGIEKPAPGDQEGTWGGTMNINFDAMDEAISGHVVHTLTATGSTGTPNDIEVYDPGDPSAAADGRNKFIEVDSASDLGGECVLRFTPATVKKQGYIYNNLAGGQNLRIFQGDYGGDGDDRDYVVSNGETVHFRLDGEGSSAAKVFIISAAIITDTIQLTNSGVLQWRNNADNDNIVIKVDTNDDLIVTVNSSDQLQYDSSATNWDFKANDVSTTGKMESGYWRGIEKAASETPAATYGEVWIKNDTPNTLWFTNDADGDVQLGARPLTTKGDLYTYTTDIARLGVGTDGQILSADSTEATGLKWITQGSGGLGAVSEDTDPNLGGHLESDGYNIYMENASSLRFYESGGGIQAGGQYCKVVAPSSIATSFTLTLPVDDGTSGQYLKVGTAGAMSWDTPTDTNTLIGLTDTPAGWGSDGQVLTSDGLGSAAWETPASSGVTQVTGTTPVSVANTTTTPVVSMAAASSGVNGYMTGTYATKLDGISTNADNTVTAGGLVDGDFTIDGWMVRTGAGSYATRTFTGGDGITITNSDGGGTPTFSVDVGEGLQISGGDVELNYTATTTDPGEGGSGLTNGHLTFVY